MVVRSVRLPVPTDRRYAGTDPEHYELDNSIALEDRWILPEYINCIKTTPLFVLVGRSHRTVD